jgi:hypothetical protein
MALWGNIDSAAPSAGTTVSVTNASTAVTGVSTTFLTDLSVGDTVIVTSGTTTKNRVAAIASNTALTLADNFTGTTAATLAIANVKIQKAPKFVYQNANAPAGKAALEQTFFVDSTEAAVATNKAKGITHSGWWRLKTYTDSASTTRYKAICLVAMGTAVGVSGDAADDSTVADS